MSTNRELIAEIGIPLYLRTYIASASTKAKYYEKGKKKIPIKYCDKYLYKSQGIREPDGINYIWKSFPVTRKRVKRNVAK